MSDFTTPISVGHMRPTTAILIIEDVVATVLDITVAAWPRLCESERVQPSDKEDEITDQLRWEVVAEKARRDPPPQLRFERETQVDDPEREYPPGRIDVYVMYSFDETDYLAMECKKVNARHETPAKKYIEKGVCRFSSGKYSPGHPCGAMIGYVTDGTAEAAAALVARKIVAFDKKATKIRTTWGWQIEKRFGQVPNLYSTKHGQAGTRNTILLLHLFLPFSSQN
ncbi:MAG: hypothetical protein ACYTG0_09370 [Planctomycetota bacterium]